MDTVSTAAAVGCAIAPDRASLAVAIVHHDRHVRSYLRMLLRGLRVTTVVEAADAADFCREHHADVALVDFDHPGGSVAARVMSFRNVSPSLAVIAVSARTDDATLGEFNAAGVIGHVPIHVIREEVAQAIATSLDRLVAARSDLRRTG